MIDLEQYRHGCVQFYQYMRKGRGSVYLGGNALLGANVIGQQILTDPRHVPSVRKALAVQPLEASVMALLTQVIKGGMVCAEIGAGCGFYSLLLASLAGPSGKIYAFESIPECFDLLVKNSRLNDLCTIVGVNAAVSDVIKEFRQTYFDVNYEFFFSPPGGYSKKEWISETTTLDLFMQREGEITLDFLKIDAEADLPKVWKGMADTLAMNPDLKILCTISQDQLSQPGNDLELFFDQAKHQKFMFYKLPNLELIDKEDLLGVKKNKTILLARNIPG